MATLQEQVSQKVQEIKQAVSGVSEEKAAKRPAAGEWCMKEVLSHLTGEENALMMYQFKRILDEDTPTLTLTPGESAYDAKRESAPLSQLLTNVETQYNDLGKFLAALSNDQLNRKARVPFLKDMGMEYPTLEQWATGMINLHLNDHIQQLRTLAQQ